MPDIWHTLPVAASPLEVFRAVATPEGLDAWWTLSSEGSPDLGHRYVLHFGPGYVWSGVVTQCEPGRSFEVEIGDAEPDWDGTRVGFALEETPQGTTVRFHHTGWPESNAHYRTSCYCWAMYLRIMKRWIERGEQVPYERRLDV